MHTIKGEAELVQLVFSPLASKMISFNGYRWSSSAGAPGDNKWRQDNGTLVRIPITTGQGGYINCFNPRIADVLLPWTSFITGSETRENVPFWLEISVPRNVSAGMYTTEFEYLTTSYLQRVARTASLQFTLQLTVWNVTKPLNRTMDTCVGLHEENPANEDLLFKVATKYGADPYSFGTNWGRQLVTADGVSEEVMKDNRERRIVPVEMSVLAVGYEQDGRVFHLLPPRPPLSLDVIYACDDKEIARFTEKFGYFRHILNGKDVPVGEVLAAHILQAGKARGAESGTLRQGSGQAWMEKATQEVITLLRDDYPTLMSVLCALADIS